MDLSLLGMLSAAESGSSSSKKASGNPVQLDGLQGGVPFNEISVSGKNLITYPYYRTTLTDNGVTFTDNGDGTITANGTVPTGKIAYFSIDHLANKLIPGATYTLTGCPEDGGNSNYSLYISERTDDDKSNGKYYLDYGNGITFEMGNYEKYNINIQIRSGVTVDNVVFRPQLELGTTATAYEPPITGRELMVGVCGKNLTPYPYHRPDSYTMNGVTYTVEADKSISTNGETVNDVSIFFLVHPLQNKPFPAGKYFISGCPKGGNGKFKVDVIDEADTKILAEDYGDGASFMLEKPNKIYIRIYFYKNTDANGLNFCPQLELGDTATEYEPYHGAEYTITPDSNPYTVPVDITQYDGVNVLSISDDSNPIISVNANKASEQLGTIYRTLDNKPALLFDGNIPTSSSAGYAEFAIDKEYSALIIVPICSESSVYEPGACTVIPIGYITEEEQGFTAYGYPSAVQRVNRPFIKRIGNTIYVRSSSTSCDRMTIYGI